MSGLAHARLANRAAPEAYPGAPAGRAARRRRHLWQLRRRLPGGALTQTPIDASGRFSLANPGKTGVQDLQFTTPQDVPEADRYGKVVFSDMHVSAGSSSKADAAFPGGCSSDDLTAQEKALAFLFFDISACVGALL